MNPWEHQNANQQQQAAAGQQPFKKPFATPNKAKFASQLSFLSPHLSDYMERISTLQDEFSARQHLIDRLVSVCLTGQVEDKVFYVLQEDEAKWNQLADILRAAIERFVVDNY